VEHSSDRFIDLPVVQHGIGFPIIIVPPSEANLSKLTCKRYNNLYLKQRLQDHFDLILAEMPGYHARFPSLDFEMQIGDKSGPENVNKAITGTEPWKSIFMRTNSNIGVDFLARISILHFFVPKWAILAEGGS
jgi:hypothetical protein